jgi:hypothetical protein
MKRFHLVLGVADVESSADDYTQRLGAGRACSSLESMRCGAQMRSRCRFGKWATKRVGLAGGIGRAMWSGVAMLPSSDYLDGVLGRLSLLVSCESKSICFRAWS